MKKVIFDHSGFYWLNVANNEGGMQISTNNVSDSDKNWEIFNGRILPSAPIKIEVYKSGKKLDFHRYIAERIVTKNFIDILLKNKITGWTTCAVVLTDKEKQLDDYFGWVVTGKCGSELKEKRVIKRRLNFAGTDFTEVFLGYYFDPETWDGSDIFSPDGTAVVLVTERVKDIFEEAGISNVSFTPLTEVESLV